MDEEKFETLRRWGDGLCRDAREEVRAAGKAILLLADEVERLDRELWQARDELRAHDEAQARADSEAGAMDGDLRRRLHLPPRWRRSRTSY